MTPGPALSIAPGWMLAVVPAGLAVVGPETEITIDLEGGSRAALSLTGTAAAADRDNRERLVDLLERHGALGTSRTTGIRLASAIEDDRRDKPRHGVIVTADEALILPRGLSPGSRRLALHAFVAGLLPEGRLRGYALLATGDGSRAVYGDCPDPALLEKRLREFDPRNGDISVIELRSGRRWEAAPAKLGRLGAAEAHRLGPIRISRPPVLLGPSAAGDLQVCVAHLAMPDLAGHSDPMRRTVQGIGDAETARTIAHAEGAERYCAAKPRPGCLIRSRLSDLPDAVEPGLLYASRPAAGESGTADAPRLWATVFTGGGARHRVPAEAVFTSLSAPAPPGSDLPSGSSGLAAHVRTEAARSRALCELVERDAFMWTWINRVSRERVAFHGIPEKAERLRDLASGQGWETRWVNLSLDTYPVILCCLIHAEKGLTLGAACDRDPATALRRATSEAVATALRFEARGESIPARDVLTPRDHLLYHRDPARRPDHGFLYSSGQEIGLAEIPAGDAGIGQSLERAGFSPLSVDLSLEACHPYKVVRALAPGLLPMTFGSGREPDAMPRARESLRTRDGRVVGGKPVAEPKAGVPHPFA